MCCDELYSSELFMQYFDGLCNFVLYCVFVVLTYYIVLYSVVLHCIVSFHTEFDLIVL